MLSCKNRFIKLPFAMFDRIYLWTFIIATGIQLFFWLFFFSRLAFQNTRTGGKRTRNPESPNDPRSQSATSNQPSVSVIICAHNEAENLERNLDRILNQSYRSFEVIVVNHKSNDFSEYVLKSLQRKFKQLRVVECDDPRPGKKHALTKGIEQAKHEVLLLTDADCKPASEAWISGMMAGMDEYTYIVLGVAPYEEAPGLLNKFIRYEACYTAMQYLSFALAGFPYMGVGRNMSYRRALFAQSGGFRKHEHLASGDDDLFVNQTARRGEVGIRLDPETFVYSTPKKTWRAYYRQKTRHFSTGKLYKLHHRLLLVMLAMSHILHYAGGLLVALKISIIFALLGYAVRMCVVMAFSSVILAKIQHRSLIKFLPVFDAVYILFYFVFAPAILMDNDTQQWS
jgi:cellulose synthase/poly-beta-1,6-N-acetylglucosamine synthase-like glycosyltransferase